MTLLEANDFKDFLSVDKALMLQKFKAFFTDTLFPVPCVNFDPHILLNEATHIFEASLIV